MQSRFGIRDVRLGVMAATLAVGTAFAQDDTPSVKVGITLFTSYTYTSEPQSKDADGNAIHPNSFDVTRAYVNVTGNLSHLLAFRVTPDIGGHLNATITGGATGETASTNLDGSLVYRIKYAYGQFNLDDWLPKGSWLRIGTQQTPYLDFMEGIYRYRFQGTMFIEREGFITSSDFGVSGHLSFPSSYGDLHLGVYNGEGYTKGEANDQKAFQLRASVRPLPQARVLGGLRLHAFYDADKYVKGGARNRFDGALTFEHKHVNAGLDYIDNKDQTSIKVPEVGSNGWGFWITPRTTIGFEGFLRYESLKPNKDVDARRNRTIAGVSYWFKTEKAAALFANYERVSNDSVLARRNETRYTLHCLFNF